ncbi:MAG: GAF domain-containing protein [Chloroflexi bacterium]|nr:GAF domain-containing protein [Chloroflexota bacterium]
MRALLRPFQTRLQWRLTALIALLIIIVVAFTVSQTLPGWRDEIGDRIHQEEEAHIEAQARELNAFLDGVHEDIVLLSDLQSVQSLGLALVETGSPLQLEDARRAVEHDFLALVEARQVYQQVRMFDVDGNEVVRIDAHNGSVEVSQEDQLQNRSNRSYFSESAILPEGGLYVSRLDLSRTGDPPAIQGTLADGTIIPVLRYGTPIYVNNPATRERVLAGVVVTNIMADNMLDLIEPSTGDAETFLVDASEAENGYAYYLQNSAAPDHTFGFEPGIDSIGGVAGANLSDAFTSAEFERMLIEDETGDLTTEDGFLVHFERIQPPGADYYWVLGNMRDEGEALAKIDDITTGALVGAVVLVIFSAGLALLVSGRITGPLSSLAQTANSIAGGDLSLRTTHADRPDDIGRLGQAFNKMADRLDTTVHGLESRVEEATRDLQTIIEVNQQISVLLDVERLLQAVTSLTNDRFGLYHVHVFLLSEDRESLVLAAGAGFVGRQMVARKQVIPISSPRSLAAKAARSRDFVIANDVEQAPEFMPNPLLPDTKSELAVPLVARGELLGVLAMQSDRTDFFTEHLLAIIEVMASQVATALANAQLFEEASQASRHGQALSSISQTIQRAASMEEVLQVTVRELGKALRVPHTAIELQLGDEDDGIVNIKS